jgi:hypothetical protein
MLLSKSKKTTKPIKTFILSAEAHNKLLEQTRINNHKPEENQFQYAYSELYSDTVTHVFSRLGWIKKKFKVSLPLESLCL